MTVEELRRLGHDVLTVQEAGNANQGIPDHAVLAFAIGEKRAVLTLNGYDFIRLDREDPTHCGIATCTYNPDYIELAVCIHNVLIANPDLTTKLVRVYRPQR